jgi:hypothetical protein
MSEQTYRGNGNHEWENVTKWGSVRRLRVPGGWIYRTGIGKAASTVYVPMPEVVKHKV